LHYFGIKALGYGPMAVAKAAGIKITLKEVKGDSPEFAEMKKSVLPFGQVPYLEHGNVKMAQGRGICRYLAHVGGLNDGLTDAEYALSEMLFEESADIFKFLSNAQFIQDATAKKAEWEKSFASLTVHLAYLEKLIGEGPYFKNGNKRLAGGVYLAAILDIFVNIRADCLDSAPKMKHFYQLMIESEIFEGIKDIPAYFKE